MAIKTFTPPVEPDVGAGYAVQPRMLEAEFGDGYSQRAGDGLNTKRKEWTLNWSALTPAQVADVDAFFDSLAAGEAFLWALNGETALKYIVTRYNRVYSHLGQLSATFKQVFDL